MALTRRFGPFVLIAVGGVMAFTGLASFSLPAALFLSGIALVAAGLLIDRG